MLCKEKKDITVENLVKDYYKFAKVLVNIKPIKAVQTEICNPWKILLKSLTNVFKTQSHLSLEMRQLLKKIFQNEI